MVAGRSLDDADVVVLNTCCIRENADNKLYGNLGHLKTVKAPRPVSDRGRRCLAQKDRELIQERAGHVDVVFGTHNVHRAAELLQPRGVDGPVTEIWEEPCSTRPRPSRRPCRPAGPTGCGRLGHHPDRLRQRLRLLHRARGAGPRDQPAVRRARRRGRGAGRRRRRRGHPARPERQLLRPGPHHPAADRGARCRRSRRAGPAWAGDRRRRARPLFADLLGAVAAGRGHPPGPLHQPAPEGPAARDHRGHGRPTRRCASTCTCRCSPAATGPGRHAPRLHAERYLERLAAGPGRHRRPGRHHRPHRRLPGRDRRRLRAHPRGGGRGGLRQRLHVHLLAPARHRGGRPGRPVRARRVVADRFERLRVVVERSALARHQARVGRVEEVLVEGPSKRDPAVLSGRTRQNKLVHFAPGPVRCGRAPSPTCGSSTPAPHHLLGELVEVTAAARATAPASRWWPI